MHTAEHRQDPPRWLLLIVLATLLLGLILGCTGCATVRRIADKVDPNWLDLVDVPEDMIEDRNPDPPEVKPSDLPDNIVWLHPDISSWPATATLKASLTRNSVLLHHNKARVWGPAREISGVPCIGNVWLLIPKDGKWLAVTWEWMRPGQTSKSKSNCNGEHIKRYDHIPKSWTPQKGVKYGLLVSGLARSATRNVRERSNVAWLTWQ